MGMKCIQCGTDNNLKDRTNHAGRCKSCNHLFAFEPTTTKDINLRITDPFFAKAITDISADSTLFFTPKQLYYLLDKRLTTRSSFKGFEWLFLYIFLSLLLPGTIGEFLEIFFGKTARFGVFFLLNLPFIIYFFQTSQSDRLSDDVRKASVRNLRVIGFLILIIGFYVSLSALNSAPAYFLTVLLGMSAIVLGTWQKKQQINIVKAPLFSEAEVKIWLDRWTTINGELPKLLPAPVEARNVQAVSPDVSAYSFDRVIVCESAAIAQLLIANNVHFENNCAVLSITGYPRSIFATVMDMLRRNSDLKVYALHNSSPQGMRLISQLKSSPNWFQNSPVQLIDLGLLPRQILAAGRLSVQSSETSAQASKQLPIEVRQGLSADELTWLDSGKFAELESFSPQRLIRIINQGLSQSYTIDESSSLLLIDDGTSSGYLYTADSFG